MTRNTCRAEGFFARLPLIGSLRRGCFQSLELFAITAAIALAVSARADGLTANPADDFARAEAAYKAGKFADAAGLYSGILAGGRYSPELFFNLGNSLYRKGDTGGAVLSFRRAWMLAPRDPDIRANMRFAMDKAGAAGPDHSLPSRALLKLSQREWAAVAVAAYWCAAGFFLAFIVRRGPAGLLKAGAGLAVVAAVGVAGILEWRSLESQPELVVRERAQALWGPMADSTPHFALPQGSIVREADRAGDWVRVVSGGEAGWIPAKSCERVYSWINAASP